MLKYKDIKIFCLAFFSFVALDFLSENLITKSEANRISFKEVKITVEGDLDLDLNCTGNETPKGPTEDRGRGNTITSKCKGKGKFKASFPQQRFIEKPKTN